METTSIGTGGQITPLGQKLTRIGSPIGIGRLSYIPENLILTAQYHVYIGFHFQIYDKGFGGGFDSG